MSLSVFHPAIARWFRSTLGEPTGAQRLGWAAIREGRDTLVAAPTGSGKTLAAFLIAIDDLLREGTPGPLPDEVRVVYVSPLKALSADIHRNLTEPRAAIARIAAEMGCDAAPITAAVRTGDTSSAGRAAMLRTPPHILITTPESLYLLLTAGRSRELLRSVRTVIVDEIHAVIGSRRGAHLALSLERLERLAAARPIRIGLSATQKPIDEVARFLVGGGAASGCAIVDEGHSREIDLDIELPRSPLEAVMAHEVWEEYYDRLAVLIQSHKTTLVFVNTRRLAERIARHLAERLGADAVTAHHGSLSKEKRLDAEERLKMGRLRALVATASLELGIDVGHVDLVCQIGSPHAIATLLQRVGRSGHTIHGTPKGRLFPTSRDDLVECVALLREVRRGELDRLTLCDGSLDVLAQQIVAETACDDYDEDALFDLIRRAYPYRELARADFDHVIAMLAGGFATRRGRRAALIHRDEVNRRVRGRRAARLIAMTSGGAIPDNADYRVVLDHDETFIGTLNEDFAIESSAGDVFQLGNTSWRITQVAAGTVRVQDAQGAPPTIPFWLGEAPARTAELSAAVSRLRADFAKRGQATFPAAPKSGQATFPLAPKSGQETFPDRAAGRPLTPPPGENVACPHLAGEGNVACPHFEGVSDAAAEQVAAYLSAAEDALGVLPTQQRIVLERFFDESGGMQLVLHAPFGSRVNRAWGLALRKRFCRQFNFELQAAATEEGLLLSLGPQHSFPLADVFRYLHPTSVRDVLIQAFLDAPVFQTRWRWNATIALAVLRQRGGRKVPAPLQRMHADDLMAAVFPDAAACLENIPGDRQVPDHPLVVQTIRDCLEEAMDLPHLAAILRDIHEGRIECVARDTTEPSPLAHEILNARPYAFLDDAPLEERRAHAVYARRATEPGAAADMGRLDADAIARVAGEAWPDPRDADELHDALVTAGLFATADLDDPRASGWTEWLRELTAQRRAASATLNRSVTCWIAAERLPELMAAYARVDLSAPLAPPESRAARVWTREDATTELVRGRLTISGPATAAALAAQLGLPAEDVEGALHVLEADGVVLRGWFSPHAASLEWCDRTLLARIHRYTLNRLRAEIEPVTPADYLRFLFSWQHVDPSARLTGPDGLRAAIGALEGFELTAGAWERDVLPARVDRYDPAMLDMLCFSGQVVWRRLSGASAIEPARALRTTPIALIARDRVHAWRPQAAAVEGPLTDGARHVAGVLSAKGALFLPELIAAASLTSDETIAALAELAALGCAVSDGFAGLRGLIAHARAASTRGAAAALDAAGRWSAIDAANDRLDGNGASDAVEAIARTLLARYGVVFRRVIARETAVPPWRDLVRVFRRLEARGEIRGGRFISGMSGEQFATIDAVTRLREVRRSPNAGSLVAISAADPLNLAGIVVGDERVPAVRSTRIACLDGVPIAALEGDFLRPLTDYDPALALEVTRLVSGRALPAVIRGFVGRAG